MTNGVRNRRKTPCEKVVELAFSFVKVSYLSLASISLRPAFKQPAATRRTIGVSGKHAMIKLFSGSGSELPIEYISEEQEGRSNSKSYSRVIMEPNIDNSSSVRISIIDSDDVDERASDYIRRVQKKNQKDLNAASKRLPEKSIPPQAAILLKKKQ